MANISEIWSKYQKYGEHTRNMVNIPKIRSTYQKYGQNTKLKVNKPERYGQSTRNMATYQKYDQVYWFQIETLVFYSSLICSLSHTVGKPLIYNSLRFGNN